MPRPYKPQPLQKPRMNMGMGVGLPSPESIVSFSAKNPVDPSSMLWSHMTRENQIKMYKLLANAVNEQMKAIERKGKESESQIYQSLKSHGHVLKNGSVGFSRSDKEIATWGKSTLKKKYLQVYNSHKSQSYSASDKAIRERRERQLAYVGIDYDEIQNNPELSNMERAFWDLYTQGRRVGLWESFGLGSPDAMDFVREYVNHSDISSIPKTKRGAYRVANAAMNYADKVRGEAAMNPNKTLDSVMLDKLVLRYNKDKMNSMYKALLYKLGAKVYGTTPIEEAFSGDKEEYYLS